MPIPQRHHAGGMPPVRCEDQGCLPDAWPSLAQPAIEPDVLKIALSGDTSEVQPVRAGHEVPHGLHPLLLRHRERRAFRQVRPQPGPGVR